MMEIVQIKYFHNLLHDAENIPINNQTPAPRSGVKPNTTAFSLNSSFVNGGLFKMAEDNAADTPKRKRGRPSKPENEKKKKVAESPGPKRGRGRPKGSKNKAKKVTASKGGKRGRPAKVKESASEESAEDAE
ncbi:hypothetical protein SK128_021817 [Halocaridina rubra]|uniref:Uncharacterized protein n=1 Tax=Halocaridina rubra TaxID=373956 RepID=A0AAN9A1F7_HALRR